MKQLYWLGTSLEDLKDFPSEVRIEAGTDLRLVQQGTEPRNWKPARSDIDKGKARYKLIP